MRSIHFSTHFGSQNGYNKYIFVLTTVINSMLTHLMLAFLELSTSGIPHINTDSECSESQYDLDTKRTSGETGSLGNAVIITLMLVTCAL